MGSCITFDYQQNATVIMQGKDPQSGDQSDEENFDAPSERAEFIFRITL